MAPRSCWQNRTFEVICLKHSVMFRSCSEMQRFSKRQKALQEIRRQERHSIVWLRSIEIVKDYGYEKYVFFDLGLLSKFHYYTGIIFQAYTYGTGEPIVKGGRYDALLQHFGKKAPAIGFCTVMESLMNALERQKISLPIANTKTMLLYPDFLQPLAVKLANEHRSKGMDVALVCFARDKVLADYEEYGRKNQFGGIVYIQKSDSVLAINLSTGEVQPVEL